jgi:uncharacterized membrane protein
MSSQFEAPEQLFIANKRASVLSLFTSTSTLICCALPALLVAMGAGAALSSLISVVPQLVWLSEYKLPIFAFAIGMMLFSGLLQWRARHVPCPADPTLAEACGKTRKRALQIYLFSWVILLTGIWFAFIAPLLME